ncbi:MAG: hypothetical protein H6R07_379 [Proteobacteria bacterium]|nr:hypothetical protein [Pseudomonadota bacterium]
MPDTHKDHFDALERLKQGKPVNVPKGTKITNDSVSLEAGRKRGSIKKSRPQDIALIQAIAAAKAEDKPQDEMRKQLNQLKAERAKDRILLDESRAREVSLFRELWDVREALKKLQAAMDSGKVTLIRKPSAKSLRS